MPNPPALPKLKVSYEKLMAILAQQGKSRSSLIRDGHVSESTLDRIQRGEYSNENTVRKLARGLNVDRTEFLESLPLAPPISATNTFTPSTTIQKELQRLLEKVWQDQHFREFVDRFSEGLGQTDYLGTLAESRDAYRDLLRIATAVQFLADHRNELALDVSNAIAHSAMVLFERHLGSLTQAPEVSAPNLLLAALYAAPRHQSDAVVRGTDAAEKVVTNKALLPCEFVPYRKQAGEDLAWMEIKRGLSLSVDALIDTVIAISHRAMREKFAYRVKSREQHAIDDGELNTKLDHVEELLGGRFVFFVGEDDKDNLALEYRERIESAFGVKTVVWKREPEHHGDAANQLERILDFLFAQAPGQAFAPPTVSPGGAPHTVAQHEPALNNTDNSLNQLEGYLETGSRLMQKAAWIGTLWRALRQLF